MQITRQNISIYYKFMSSITHLPHILNVQSGVNKYDQVSSAVFEVYFTLPDPIRSEFAADELTLTEQVTEVSGLDALNKTTGQGVQKFLGVDVSFQNPTLDNTYAEFQITFNLNLRDVTDNFVHKIFRAWENLNYNLADGTRNLKSMYTSDSVHICEANRNGEVYREFVFKHVLLTGVTGTDSLNYVDNEARKLVVSFRADYWTEVFQ